MPAVAGYDPNPSDNIGVEVSFTASPDGVPTWTDVTEFVDLAAGLSITRGRQDEFSLIQPSSCSLTLDNHDGRFTAENAASPYYPYVKPYRKIRVFYTAPGSGVRTYRFTGYVEEWPVEWPGGGAYSQVQITGTDRLSRLGSQRALRSVIEETVLDAAPFLYYPLGEEDGATSAGDLVGTHGSALTVAQYGTGGTLEFGTATGPPTDSLSAPTFTRVDSANGKGLSALLVTDYPAAGVLSVRCSFLSSTVAQQVLVQLDSQYVDGEVILYINGTGKLAVAGGGWSFGVGAGNTLSMASAATVTDGLTHDAVLTLDGGTARLYIDGALAVSDTYTERVQQDPVHRIGIGAAPVSYNAGTANYPMTGVICHVALFGSVLTAAQVLEQYEATSTGFSGDTSDERIARYAGWAGIATADLSLDVGNSTSVCFVDTTDQAVLQVMQDVAHTTEGGRLFVDGAGLLVFHARSRLYDQHAATASVDATLLGEGTTFTYSTQGLFNEWIGTRPNGATTRVSNTESVAEYGVLSQSVNILTTSDTEVRDAVSWRAQTSGSPKVRIPAAEFDLYTDSTGVQEQLRSIDIGSRVTVTGLPDQAPTSTVQLIVEGYTENISLTGWTLTANTTNYETVRGWVWDQSEWDDGSRWTY